MTVGTFEPFFVTGFQRSGTTLLRVIIDSHPDIAVPFDTVGLWERYWRQLDKYGNLRTPQEVRRMASDILAEERIRLWEVPLDVDRILACRRREGFAGLMEAFYRAYADHKGKRYWGDKDPGNMRRLHLVNEWFPCCRVVHIIRDGRDACLSLVEQPFGGNDVLQSARGWVEEVGWVRQIGAILGRDRYLEVIYESLIADPVTQTRRVCEFLRIDYSDAMLAYHEHDSAIPREKRHLWRLINQPPQAGNAARWKREMSPAARICLERRAGDLLRELGYETLTPPVRGGYSYELWTIIKKVASEFQRRS